MRGNWSHGKGTACRITSKAKYGKGHVRTFGKGAPRRGKWVVINGELRKVSDDVRDRPNR